MTRRAGGLRVVAGRFGGRRLEAPAGSLTRPTTERVREAVFNALAGRIGPRVLDLYAGSGALGIEALSRGAETVVLVDRDERACRTAARNLAALGIDRAHGRVVRRDAAAFLRAGPPPEAPFDLVTADPPYDEAPDRTRAVLEALAGPGWLAADPAIVVEQDAASGLLLLPDDWDERWQRVYGDTLVTLAIPPSPETIS